MEEKIKTVIRQLIRDEKGAINVLTPSQNREAIETHKYAMSVLKKLIGIIQKIKK